MEDQSKDESWLIIILLQIMLSVFQIRNKFIIDKYKSSKLIYD